MNKFITEKTYNNDGKKVYAKTIYETGHFIDEDFNLKTAMSKFKKEFKRLANNKELDKDTVKIVADPKYKLPIITYVNKGGKVYNRMENPKLFYPEFLSDNKYGEFMGEKRLHTKSGRLNNKNHSISNFISSVIQITDGKIYDSLRNLYNQNY